MRETQPKRHLAAKLAGYGIILALLTAVISSSLIIWLDFRNHSERLENDIRSVLETYREPINLAVFNIDSAAASVYINGIITLDYVTTVRVFHHTDTVGNNRPQLFAERSERQLTVYTTPGQGITSHELASAAINTTHSAPVVRLFNRTTTRSSLEVGPLSLQSLEMTNNKDWGFLELEIDLDRAYAPFFARALWIFSITLLLILSFAGLLFFIFFQLATKPILNVIKALDQIQLGTGTVQRLQVNRLNEDDEIGQLTHELNGFINTAERLLSERDLFTVTLQKTYDEIRHLVDFLPQLIFITDQAGYVRLSNKKFRQLMGMHKEALENMHRSELAEFFDVREREFLLGPDEGVIRTSNPILYPEVIIQNIHKEKRSFEVSKFSIAFENNLSCLTVAIDTTDLRRSADRIQHLAYHDSLTDLPNRTLFIDRLNRAMIRSKRNQTISALLFIDLDGFKGINDSLGHAAGDEHLRHIARQLQTMVRETDTVARLGGDEFVICLCEMAHDPLEAQHLALTRAQQIRELIATPYELHHRKVFVSASIGITFFPCEIDNALNLLKSADTAMYHAKGLGKNTEVIYNAEMGETVNDRVLMENDLRDALEMDQFFLCYQPQVNCQTNIITGCEALLRWNHPTKGLISPAVFIPLLESTRMITQVGSWVLSQCCHTVAKLKQLGLWQSGMRMSINVSPYQFTQLNFTQTVLDAVDQAQIEARDIDLEVTESMLIHSFNEVTSRMHELKTYGIHFSIDDFGTGYSSLSYLKMLPLNVLKIDQSFIRDLLVDSNDEAIVTSILAMAGHMGLETVAEGVEQQQQLDFIKTHGCHRYQGYLFSKPIPFDELVACLSNQPPQS